MSTFSSCIWEIRIKANTVYMSRNMALGWEGGEGTCYTVNVQPTSPLSLTCPGHTCIRPGEPFGNVSNQIEMKSMGKGVEQKRQMAFLGPR